MSRGLAGVASALRATAERAAYAPAGMRLLRAARVLAAPGEFIRRRSAARAALRERSGALALARERPGALALDRQRGCVRFGPDDLAGAAEILAECARAVERVRPHLGALLAARSGNRRLTIDLLSDDELARQPAYVDFALQPAVLLAVVQYLGTVPFLSRLALGLSLHLPELGEPGFHQRFHVDNDDVRQAKLFVNACDVGPSEGPLCFLPAGASARALRALRRERPSPGRYATYSDEEVFRHCDRSELIQLTGPAGSGAVVDLSRCLHYGSRVAAGRERLMLMAAFLCYHRVHHNASNALDERLAGADPLRRLALRSPARYPHGYFCPDPLLALATAPRDGAAPIDRPF